MTENITRPNGARAYERLSDPNTKMDMWGPRTLTDTEGYLMEVPRKPKPWGLADIGWALVAIVAIQVVLLPVLIVMAISQYNIALDSPGGADQLADAVAKVATTGPGLVLAMTAQFGAFVGVPVWASYRKGHRSLAKDFGFVFKRRDIALGLGLAIALQLLLAGISWVLNQTSLDLSEADNTGQVTDQVGILLVFMILAASIGAPLTEELLFRGLILRAFLRKLARWDLAPVKEGLTDHFHPPTVSTLHRNVGVVLSVLLSSALFGVMHFQNVSVGSVVVIAQTGLLGLVFAIVVVKTRRLGIAIVGHLFFNSMSIALTLLLS